MSSLVSPQQSAFAGGRMIQDNIIVAHEAFHFLKQKQGLGGKGIALKLDMNKAYDRVNWEFLSRVLRAFGFAESWVASIMTLVTTVSYNYQVNGFSSPKVTPKRGLRQGDPLSPYLFILIFDVLSRLITMAYLSNELQGIKLAESARALSHLFFCR